MIFEKKWRNSAFFATALLLTGVVRAESCVSIGAVAPQGDRDFSALREKLGGLDHVSVYYNPVRDDTYARIARAYLDKGLDLVLVLALRDGVEGATSLGTLAKVREGGYDSELVRLANAIKRDGRTIVVRPLYELNGDWYPWQAYYKGNNPRDLIAAWRHTVSIFRERNAPVLFDLNYNRNSAGKRAVTDFQALYPGDEYVDSISISSYNRCGSGSHHTTWKEFRDEFDPAYDQIVGFTKKPIAIAETSSTSRCGGNKAAWFENLFSDLADRYPRVVNATFYLHTKQVGKATNTVPIHWELENAEQVRAFQRGKQKVWSIRGVCPVASVAGLPTKITKADDVRVHPRGLDITFPWSVFLEGTTYLGSTYNDGRNPVTREEFGRVENMVRWRFKQAAVWDLGKGTFGPWISYQGVQSNNDNRWWENYHGVGVGLEYCAGTPSFARWGGLCGVLGYERQWYTAPIPQRLTDGDDSVYFRLRLNMGGEW